ncbi:MAG: FHA domain-containing protein, partial [Acidimicrobiales bacterium]|nr:FHA domain-containing protein [Acidimicrobiales bacterium]
MLQLRGSIDGVERTVVLDRSETSLGRADDNDVVLSDLVASPHHAVVLHEGDRWWVRDLESRYGLRVNDDVADEIDLEPGDVVTIGTVDFVVEVAPAAAPPGPPPAPP